MTVLQVHKFPHPLLKQRAKPVTRFDAELAKLADDMLETMYAEGGIGLAAVQVGRLTQLVVTDLSAEDEEGERTPEPRFYVNPRLLTAEGEIITEEGCLSVEEFTADVPRAQQIVVNYETLQGDTREEALEELAAVCLQHEMDHLQGKLFIDRLPPVKRQLVKKRLAKLARSA